MDPPKILLSKSLPSFNFQAQHEPTDTAKTRYHAAKTLSFADDQYDASESAAELEVLKSIISREGYLNRLINVTKTVKRKFKPELCDLIDFVRACTLDVVNAIEKWKKLQVQTLQRIVIGY